MDKEKAKGVLTEQLRCYRSKSYETLKGLIGRVDAFEITGPDGTDYQIEIEAMWDGKPQGNIMVAGGIDDGGRSAFSPQMERFIMTPGGKIVGE